MMQSERVPFLRGEGNYVDDIPAQNAVQVAFVRSPYAHADINDVDVTSALAMPGVVAVLTGREISSHIHPIKALLDPPEPDLYHVTDWHPAAVERVRYVGEIVAVVVAEDRYQAEDAAGEVEVDYEPLSAVTDIDEAQGPGAPKLHDQVPDNVLFHSRRVSASEEAGDPFTKAPVKTSVTVRHPRLAGLSMEGAAVIASIDEETAKLEVITSTQVPHLIQDGLSQFLDMAKDQIRVIAPDVGGGFGPKAQLYPEELLVAHLARRLHRPVKWIQDRSEHLAASFHSRDVVVNAELATDNKGIILALRATAHCAAGAYSAFPLTCALEVQTIGGALSGPYRVPHYEYEGRAIAINTYPVGAYRGVGFPLGPLIMETLLDRVARVIGEDPAEIRRRNLIAPEELPTRNPTGVLYDSGDYPTLLKMALERVEYEKLRRAQREAASDRFRLGIGISSFVELTATNNQMARRRGMVHVPGYDSARLKVTRSGIVEAYLSTPSQGQSQRTTFARLLANTLEIDAADVSVILGDTQVTPYGSGTFASRSLVSAGGALQVAARELCTRMCELAAILWQVDAAEVQLVKGIVSHPTDPTKRFTIAELGSMVHSQSDELPSDWEEGLEACVSHDPPEMPVSAATHLAVVEVDTFTGMVEILRYVVAEDCGPMLDKSVVEGQLRGAIAQGIGSALYEEIHYDLEGQFLSGTLQDYLVPGIFDVPHIEILHLSTPSPYTEGGYKGVAEGGTIGAPAAIVNAVSDALQVRPDLVRLPLTPERVLQMLEVET